MKTIQTVRIVQIVVWSAAAVVLTGLLVFFLAHGGDGRFPASTYGAGEKAVDKTVSDDVSGVAVEVASADVVYATGGSGIHVVCYGDGDGYTVEESGGTLHVAQKWKPFSWHWFPWGGQRVEITLPASYRGSLSNVSASGDVVLPAELSPSSFTCTTASGDIGGSGAASLTAGDIRVSTASGDIRLGGVDGKSFSIRSVSGDVTVGTLAGQGSVDSTSGDLRIGTLARMDGAVSAATVSGDIQLALGQGVAASIAAHSLSGNISSSRALSFTGRHDASGQSGAGSGQPLRLSSTSGDIRIG